MSRRDNWQPEDGMGFAGLVPTLAEKRQEAYEQRQIDTIRDLREQLAARSAEVEALRKSYKQVGYLITWFDDTYRGKQTISFDPCDEDDGTCVPVYAALQEKSRDAG